ncbi:YciI family protein [Streptomyces sp. NRRL F-2664]|uniref:YciI family protein n=1 Tax=Streptomyces sp. NRRL F-2664 TaxID=1463842 RepID=UPI0004C926B9|nr:YciI family protein [Streptomyces sp. NRRL F-2664]
MKYMLMVLGSQADYDAMGGRSSGGSPAWSEADLKAMFDHMSALNEDLVASGEWVDGQGLTEPRMARLVTAAPDGTPVVSDGPYGGAEEVLAGYWIVDVPDFARAAEIAARAHACPVPEGAPNPPVVVRPVDSTSGTDM